MKPNTKGCYVIEHDIDAEIKKELKEILPDYISLKTIQAFAESRQDAYPDQRIDLNDNHT